jgi:hypothetical protein
MNKLLLVLSSIALVLNACATYKDVRPGVDGVNRVVIPTDDKDAGSREAIRQANNYCQSKKKEAAFIDEKSQYTGDMDESTYKNSKRVAKVAKTVGGTVWALGGKKESNVGGIAGVGGAAADQALGNGYQVEMKFKCQ